MGREKRNGLSPQRIIFGNVSEPRTPRDGGGQDLRGRRPFGPALEAEVLALGRADRLERGFVDALRSGEALAGRGQGAVGPLGDGQGRPGDDLLPVLLSFGEIAGDDEAARGGQGLERADIDAGVEELLAKARLELLEGRADMGGRELLGQQLEKEFHQAPSFPPVYRRAMSLTRARIWEIILTLSVTLIGAPGIEQIEVVGALQAHVVGRQEEVLFDQPGRFLLAGREGLAEHGRRRRP